MNGQPEFVIANPTTRPKGAYVVHKGQLYPADKGYPAQVLIDCAGMPGQLVLIGANGGVILGFSEQPERVRFLSKKDAVTWERTLARASLLSTGPALGIGETGLPAIEVDLSKLQLPPTESRRAAVNSIIRAAAILFMVAAATMGANVFAGHRITAAENDMKAIDARRVALSNEVKALETSIASLPDAAPTASSLPEVPQSALVLSGSKTLVKVKEGHGYGN